jgi:hypothetical protein
VLNSFKNPKKVISRQFDQINALINAVIHNNDLRKDLVIRDDFWAVISEIIPILTPVINSEGTR